ncbi:unnamed protein product [Clavelina lepadiformis]|uniref:Gap junction protein n=1 Tax=Clavelina lepadiformis TaxID=159417 RepID=A0ABP0FDV8_CLALP
MSWHFLDKWLYLCLRYSTHFGKLVVIIMIYRIIFVSVIGERVYNDEQSEFRCNTNQPWCSNVCFNSFSPISHLRFWSFQILLISMPPIVYFLCCLHWMSKKQSLQSQEESLQEQDSKNGDDTHINYRSNIPNHYTDLNTLIIMDAEERTKQYFDEDLPYFRQQTIDRGSRYSLHWDELDNIQNEYNHSGNNLEELYNDNYNHDYNVNNNNNANNNNKKTANGRTTTTLFNLPTQERKINSHQYFHRVNLPNLKHGTNLQHENPSINLSWDHNLMWNSSSLSEESLENMRHFDESQRQQLTSSNAKKDANKQKMKVPRLYLFSSLLCILLEVAFAVAQVKAFGFSVPELYQCRELACHNTVDCFSSRPQEKTVFLWLMLVHSGLSMFINLLDFFGVITVHIFSQRKRKQTLSTYI